MNLNTEKLFGSIELLGIFIAISVLTVIIATLFKKTFGKYVKYSTEVLQNDPTNYKFLKHSITALSI